MKQIPDGMVEINLVEDAIIKLVREVQTLVESANDINNQTIRDYDFKEQKERVLACQDEVIQRLDNASAILRTVRARTKNGDL